MQDGSSCLSPAQCRAARALIGWSEDDLSSASKIPKATIAGYEAGKLSPDEQALRDMKRCLEDAGVLFIPENGGGAGVRLARPASASIDTDETETVQYEEYLKNDAPPGAGG
ncbi:helix-turn-helix transcriptional regulator [Rhizobium sp. CBN3]|uniref:helix-turn-helix domain-containing protein n=1 Tax=Rhizobium sp. CBN3 TaxID=3058045 RepID=UPI00267386EB|nr:helix-turn-helix transcriptional regulator [Rhizobium sp. CBN3]MDO3431812.1 helix-turn-helix transcriptional regulator [Rhizobium sp. CBN3]